MLNKELTLILCLSILLLTGCYRKFYQTHTVSNPSPEKYQSIDPDSSFVIIHFTDKIIQLRDISVSNDSITGNPSIPDPIAARYVKPYTNRPNPFRRKHREYVLRQVHIYLDEPYKPDDRLVILRAQVKRFDMYGFDQQATKKSSILSTIGLILSPGLIFLLAVIIFSIGWNGWI